MSKPTARAASPASLTGFFRPRRGAGPQTTSSPGWALCLEPGVTAEVSPAPRTRLTLAGNEVDIAPLRDTVLALAPEPVHVALTSAWPLGCGFGVSAGACLSAAFALAGRFGLDHDRRALATLSHRCEVAHGTGLGDVAAQLAGGSVWRLGGSDPLATRRLTLADDMVHIAVHGPLSTADVLGSPTMAERLETQGDLALAWLAAHDDHPTLAELLDRSRLFAQDTGLLTDASVRRDIAAVLTAGGQATMILLGQGTVATLPAGDGPWTPCAIASRGTHWLP